MECLFCDAKSEKSLASDAELKDIVFDIFSVANSNSACETAGICDRCKINVEIISNGMKLKDSMTRSLAQVKQEVAPSNGNQTKLTNGHSTPMTNGRNLRRSLPATLPGPTASFMNNFPTMSRGFTSPYMRAQRFRNVTTGPKIEECKKCGVNLKTRSQEKALKHLRICTGHGLPRGRPRMFADSELFKCTRCARSMATVDMLEAHKARCDGATQSSGAGRKCSDNKCVICGEDLKYRAELKKHMKEAHNISAQRLDDSVLSALRGGDFSPAMGPKVPVYEAILNQIKPGSHSDLEDPLNQSSNSSRTGDCQSANGTTDTHHVKMPVPPVDNVTSLRSRLLFEPVACGLCGSNFNDHEDLAMHNCSSGLSPPSTDPSLSDMWP